jgi:hypothetical protein
MARLLWTQKARFGPRARHRHAAAYDATRSRLVVFGGSSLEPPDTLHDTWEWDGEIWIQMADFGPAARERHAMAFDSDRQRTVLFGGFVRDGTEWTAGDTWEWNGEFWTQVSDTGPSPRHDHAMAYDSTTGRVVLQGGSGTVEAQSETWEWDGESWTQTDSDTGPGPRLGHAMAYDESRKRLVLFGGGPDDPGNRDTWERKGATWARASTSGPAARQHHAMASGGETVILFGGLAAAGVESTTWQWDGKHWAQRGDFGPRAGFSPAMAYDSARARLVLFGGQVDGTSHGDTWELAEYPIASPTPS